MKITIKQLNNILQSARKRFNEHLEDRQVYRSLLEDTKISDYFSRYYPFVEIQGMRKFLSKSKHFDSKFIDKISSEVKMSRELFHNSLKDAAAQYGSDFKIKVCDRDLSVMARLFEIKLYPLFARHNKPNFDEVINGMNLRASSGLPEPWFSKNKMMTSIHNILNSVLDGSFDLYNGLSDKQMFSSAFKRFQITSTKMKARLVYCLSHVINVCEKFYDIMFKTMFSHPQCPMVHGKTQVEISELLCQFSHLYSISYDVKGFDIKTPGEVICLAFEVMHLCLGYDRDSYYSKLFFDIRDLLLCMPCFHPVIGLVARKRGLSSGSGLTSSLNSFCMYIMHTLCLLNYCKLHNKNIFRCTYTIIVSGDDSVLFTGFKINTKQYELLFLQMFDLELEFESGSNKGVNEAVFLGSKWIDGLPYRNLNRMFGRILFGSPNIPKFGNDHLLFCSRCYDILGNVADFEAIWKTFCIPMSDRVFRFAELMDFEAKNKFLKMNLLDRRGYWKTRDPSVRLDNVWRSR